MPDELRGPLRDGYAALAPQERRALAEALRAARERQAAALDDAAEQAFEHVPRLLRGAVRRGLR